MVNPLIPSLSEFADYNIYMEPALKQEPEEIKAERISFQDNGDEFLVTQSHVLDWQRHFLKQGHPYTTVKAYFTFISRFVGAKTYVTQQTVNKFRRDHLSGVCMSALKAFFNFLVIHYNFPETIFLIRFDKNKRIERSYESLSPDEFKKITRLMDPRNSVELETSHRLPMMKDKFLTIVLYACALRVSEGLKLKWSDINWEEWLKDRTKQAIMTIKKSKRDKTRLIPVSPEIAEALYMAHKHRDERGIPVGGLVFDYGIDKYLSAATRQELRLKAQFDYLGYAKNRYYWIITHVAEKAIGRKLSAHPFRRAKATDMANNGVPIEVVSEFLGHNSIATTQNYINVTPERLKKELFGYQSTTRDLSEEKPHEE